MHPKDDPKAVAADGANFERLVKLVTAVAVGGVFLIAGVGALAQPSPHQSPPAQEKTLAKPGAQTGQEPAKR